LTVTVSAVLVPPWLSVTVKLKVRLELLEATGAVNVGPAIEVLLSVTEEPAVCVQAYEAMLPSESVPDPASVTAAPAATD
jgi:hypothetical protein